MPKRFHVAVLGAAGGIGQTLSLLLSQNEDVKKLSLYDVVPVVEGVAKDISHINSDCEVVGFSGSIKDKEVSAIALAEALEGVNLVLVAAGKGGKPGMTRDDVFGENAEVAVELMEGIASTCPKAIIGLIINPVNSVVPIAAEILKKHGVFDPKKLFGVSTLDIVRANKFIGEVAGIDPAKVNVPVVGGHSGATILPLLSQISPKVTMTQSEVEAITKKIQTAGKEVIDVKKGSATLSMAFAGARFAASVMKGLKGEKDIVECSYVYNPVKDEYFAWPIKLGVEGVEEIMMTSDFSSFEASQVKDVVKPHLVKAVDKGIKFASSKL